MGIINSAVEWLSSHADEVNVNVVAGIIASVLVLLFQGFVRTASLVVASFFSLQWKIRFIWRLGKPNSLYVVSGAIADVNENVSTAILRGPDAYAANLLIANMGLLYAHCEVKHVYSSSFSRDFYREHLIVVGGPINNRCSADMLKHLEKILTFDNDCSLHFESKVYEPEYDENDNPVRDYGVVVRMDNPYDEGKNVLLILGCDTHGVLAAARLISARSDVRLVRKQLLRLLGIRRYTQKQNFIAVVECGVLDNDIGRSSLVAFRLL